jgi:hypothetical protein
MVVLPELSSPMMMIFSYFLPTIREKSLPKKLPINYYYCFGTYDLLVDGLVFMDIVI